MCEVTVDDDKYISVSMFITLRGLVRGAPPSSENKIILFVELKLEAVCFFERVLNYVQAVTTQKRNLNLNAVNTST